MTQPLVGQRLGPYDILSLIGSGGMGEVYRARDTTLSRDVAIKILPSAVVDDADRRARFEREARILAALTHPHIAAIYGFEHRDGVYALVLELVEGQTLADRLRAGAVPRREALEIARQIADALDAAHEKGIVHRDLKPANISITHDGVVKVLDFGLAKAGAGGPVDDLTDSPTMTVADTRDGVVLGTAPYMSPEQARGKSVDKRTDIWAFGCVMYEMLAGRPAFAADTVSDLMVAILDREPDWRLLPPDTPTALGTTAAAMSRKRPEAAPAPFRGCANRHRRSAVGADRTGARREIAEMASERRALDARGTDRGSADHRSRLSVRGTPDGTEHRDPIHDHAAAPP